MNILADESVDRPIVEKLRAGGYTVLYVAEMEPGISDEQVLNSANQERALLLTADKDFGELHFRQRRTTFGVVLVRMSGLSAAKKSEIVLTTFDKYGKELLNSFSVITAVGVRVRKI